MGLRKDGARRRRPNPKPMLVLVIGCESDDYDGEGHMLKGGRRTLAIIEASLIRYRNEEHETRKEIDAMLVTFRRAHDQMSKAEQRHSEEIVYGYHAKTPDAKSTLTATRRLRGK